MTAEGILTIRKLKPVKFGEEAKKFLGHKLTRDLEKAAIDLEPYEEFLQDPGIQPLDVISLLAAEGVFEEAGAIIKKHAGIKKYLDTMVDSLISGPMSKSLSVDQIIQMFKANLFASFKDIPLGERPLLRALTSDLHYLVIESVLRATVSRKETITNIPAQGILMTRHFAKVLPQKMKAPEDGIDYEAEAKKTHDRLKTKILAHAQADVPLEFEETANGFIKRVTISRGEQSPKSNGRDFLDYGAIRVVYDHEGNERHFITTISLFNEELNGWGTISKSLETEFRRDPRLYHYFKFKIFEAVEKAIKSGAVKAKEMIVQEEVTHVQEDVHEEVEQVLGNETIIIEEAPKEEKKELTGPERKERVRKQIEGAKQFTNIRLDRAKTVLLKFPDVEEVNGSKHHNRLTKVVNGKRLPPVSLLPSCDSSNINPYVLAKILTAFGISAEEFLKRL